MMHIRYYGVLIGMFVLAGCAEAELPADSQPVIATAVILKVDALATEDSSLIVSAGVTPVGIPKVEVQASEDSSLGGYATVTVETPVLCQTAQDANAAAFKAQVIVLANLERAKVNAGSLTEQAELTQAAQGHAFDMACNLFMSHTGSNGSSPFDRMQRFGYAFSAAAKNVAAGYGTPVEVVQGWMESPGHRKNMLDPAYTQIGIGYVFTSETGVEENYFHYWVMVLGRPQ